jgi:hypothetical protein
MGAGNKEGKEKNEGEKTTTGEVLPVRGCGISSSF